MSSQASAPRNDTDPPDQRASLVRRYNVERSCLRCHERKVRCNKAMPCSACIRAKASCRYPGPEWTKRRSQSHRETEVRLAPRLERLERAIDAITSLPERAQSEIDAGPLNFESNAGAFIVQHPVPEASRVNSSRRYRSSPPDHHPTRGMLVKDGASTRYINESMLSQMLEKETELQSAISTPASQASLEKRLPSHEFHGLISNPNFYPTDQGSFFPSRRQAVRLWQAYLNNVNPLARLLHIPTIQPAFFSAINDHTQVPADLRALLFAIYYAAVTSLDESEVNLILGQDRQSAVNIYQQGLEVNLHAASFLDSPTITSLQAFSLYLMCRRRHNSGLSGWTLNGLLSRAAQTIGLHRDGENFKLSPFDCEVRRRLWWQIRSIESRVAEDHGLFTGDVGSYSDTKLPANINDSDMTVDMKCAPEPKQGWSEMTSYLVVFETNKAIQEMHNLTSREGNTASKTVDLERFLRDFKEEVNAKHIQYLDANIPIQKYSLFLAYIQLGKLEVMVQQQNLKGLPVEKAAEMFRDETLLIACDAIEKSTEMRADDLLKHFYWLLVTYPPYILLTYSLWHLCFRPDTPSADRAWHTIEQSLQQNQRNLSPHHGPKLSVISKLREKALSIRDSYLSRKNNAATALPELGNQEMPTERLDEDIFNIAMEEGMVWDFDFNLISEFQAFPSDSFVQGRPFPM